MQKRKEKDMIAGRCKGKTRAKYWPYNPHDCTRKAKKDGYCMIHHPEEKLRKHKERMAKKEAMFQSSQTKKP